jgi:UDP-N-acetylmuramate--alanine ligase
LVAEADESDRSFLMLWPSIAVMTNIDHEHMESYGSFAELQQAFADFANKVPFYGSVVACADDPHLAPVLPRLTRRLVTYGLDSPDAHVRGTGVELGAFGARCAVSRRTAGASERLGTLEVQVPGRHNLQNALAAVVAAAEVGVEFDVAAAALRLFQGAERRFQQYGEADGVLVVDDYGHHPTEIAAVLSAARASLGRRLVVVFQPHRYSRTARLMDAFGASLSEADDVLLTDIYAAGEDPIPGVTADALAEAVRRESKRPVRVIARLEDVVPELMTMVRAGDAVITLGAGSVGALPAQIVAALRRREGGA